MRDLFIIGRRFYCAPFLARLSHIRGIRRASRESKPTPRNPARGSIRCIFASASALIRASASVESEPVRTARIQSASGRKSIFLVCCVCCLRREEEARKAAEAISEENIVPYKIALADLPPVFPEQILKEETVIERYEEEKIVVEHTAPLSAEEEVRREEKLAEEKPVDANSEIVPNKNLTDDEIAQLILEEEELLSDQGLLGVNFKKLRPRVPVLKDSKVLEELQHIATAEPERVQELKRTSTFLQKPQRPVPNLYKQKTEEDDGETYKVVIKKQDKKTVIARLVEKGLLPPGSEATIAKTPEPPEPSEVKMHETKNRLEADRLPVMFDPKSSCSTSPLDTTNDSLSCSSELDETCFSEDQPARRATYKCKPKFFHVKPNHYRRYSSAGRYETGTSSPIKGHYLEKVLRGYAHSCVSRDRQIDDEFNDFAKIKSGDIHLKKYSWLTSVGCNSLFSSGITSRRRTSKCGRAHYAERILLKNVNAVVRHLCSKPETTRVIASRMRRTRTKGKYLATFLNRESTRLMSLMTMLFQFLLQRPNVSESSNLEIRKRRMSFKGRYLEQFLQKNVTPVLQRVNETCFVDDHTKMIEERKGEPRRTRTKGRYMEKCLHRQNLRLKSALANLLDYAKNRLDNLFTVATSSKVKRGMRGRYFERLVRRNLKILELFAEYVRSRISDWLKEGPSCTSREEFPVISICTYNCIADDAVLNQQKTDDDEDFCDVKISEWHEDGPSCQLQKELLVTVGTDTTNTILNEEEIGESIDHNILECSGDLALSEEANEEANKCSKSTDTVPEEEDTFSKFLQSTEDYISAEIFHRGSRRLSRSRKSIDIVSNEDDNTFSKFLYSTEDYVSTELFHRGNRRHSRSRKSIDIISNEDDNAFSKFLYSTEDYVSTELFHRGSRRRSRLSKDMGQEKGILLSLLEWTGTYVSSEVFHRKSRRLSRSRRESISLVTPALWGDLKSLHLSLPWFSLRVTEKSDEHSEVCEKKIDPENERDNRRLSFVPTILYQGVTNRIGVDFTRLVAYAFVPCTSIILLYMYK